MLYTGPRGKEAKERNAATKDVSPLGSLRPNISICETVNIWLLPAAVGGHSVMPPRLQAAAEKLLVAAVEV